MNANAREPVLRAGRSVLLNEDRSQALEWRLECWRRLSNLIAPPRGSALRLGGHWADGFAHRRAWATNRSRHRNWRTLLECADDRSFINSNRDKLIGRAHRFDHLPLTRGQHLGRQGIKVAKDPDQVKPLHKGGVEVARAEWS